MKNEECGRRAGEGGRGREEEGRLRRVKNDQ